MNSFQPDSGFSIRRALPAAAFVVMVAVMTLAAAPPADAQTYTVLHDFTGGVDGGLPHQLTLGGDGNFYGTSTLGGANSQGNLYRLDTSGTLTVLYSFTGGAGGCMPEGSVFRDSNGDLYGTTHQCGDPHCSCGVFFKLGASNVLTILHTFTKGADGSGPEGEYPSNNLVSVNGELYGTTEAGGSTGWGVLYKITKTGHYTVLQSLPEGGIGAQGDLTRDSAGNIYGETWGPSYGSIFELDTAGNFSTAYTFADGVDDGGGPVGRLLLGAGGTFTGASSYTPAPNSCGLIYRLESDGTETALHHFFAADGENGCSPQTGVIDVGGTLYGTTAEGGGPSVTYCYFGSGCGVLFQISPSGVYSVLHRFTGPEGAWPQDELTKGNDGNVYGVAKLGGTGNCGSSTAPGCGVIFKYTP